MKVIIAGSRSIDLSICQLEHIICNFCIPVSEVVCGLAKGPDLTGKAWAADNKIPVKEFPADWQMYGKKAGILRNEQMGDYADELLAIWDGKSRGTAHMIQYMEKLGKPTHVYRMAI